MKLGWRQIFYDRVLLRLDSQYSPVALKYLQSFETILFQNDISLYYIIFKFETI